ncbi:MAG TPA: hypothetical protein VHJ83_03090, partial [Micromonosporaceae bacterium]|nr:hypothetical protein [Micromonosporaceae bacterium]
MRVPFDPARDGFGFINGFVNRISIADIPISTSQGRCGGMAFAALDYWHHRLPMPDARKLPPDGNPVADYIYQRQLISIVDNWLRYFHFMRTPDRPSLLGEIGVARSTREEEFPKLKRLLDQGLPQPLGLVQSRDFGGFEKDHQVVGYGYELDGDRTRVFIWDNVHRHREDVLEFSTRYDPGDRAVCHSDGRKFRGFFVERYSPRRPGHLSEGKAYRERSDDRVFVIYGGAKFWVKTRQEFEHLGIQRSDVTEVPAG